MAKTVFNVNGMSCMHCVNAITNAVNALPGVSETTVVLDNKTVTVEHDPGQVSADNIKYEIEEQGYEIVS
jgi:copper chaperone